MRKTGWMACLLVAIPLLSSGCAHRRTTSVPVPTLVYAKSREGQARSLVIFLPGRGERGGDFDRRRFIGMARQRGADADLMEVDLHLGYYLEGTASRRLWEDVVAPARASGYRRIWIVGISLGGSGAIGLAREHPDSLEGLVLLSPYLGPPELAKEIRARGGLQKWTPAKPHDPGSFEGFFEGNWGFLRRVSSRDGRPPALYLGYGRSDRMALSLDLLAESLPAGDVIRVPGGHGWRAWHALWAEILSRRLFDEPKTGSSTAVTGP
jgi:pimeloyl-ACP methyl ester carboxylesterase